MTRSPLLPAVERFLQLAWAGAERQAAARAALGFGLRGQPPVSEANAALTAPESMTQVVASRPEWEMSPIHPMEAVGSSPDREWQLPASVNQLGGRQAVARLAHERQIRSALMWPGLPEASASNALRDFAPGGVEPSAPVMPIEVDPAVAAWFAPIGIAQATPSGGAPKAEAERSARTASRGVGSGEPEPASGFSSEVGLGLPETTSGLTGIALGSSGTAYRPPGTAFGVSGTASGAPGIVVGVPGTAFGAPGTASEAPSTAYGAPGTASEAPGTAYGAPGLAYGAPGTAYGEHGTASGTPGTASGAPGTASGAPGLAYGAPGTASGAPGSASGAPGLAYGAPDTAYGSPGTAFGPPGTALGPPGTTHGGIDLIRPLPFPGESRSIIAPLQPPSFPPSMAAASPWSASMAHPATMVPFPSSQEQQAVPTGIARSGPSTAAFSPMEFAPEASPITTAQLRALITEILLTDGLRHGLFLKEG